MQHIPSDAKATREALMSILEPLTVNVDSWDASSCSGIVKVASLRDFANIALTAYKVLKQPILREGRLLILFYNNVCYIYDLEEGE